MGEAKQGQGSQAYKGTSVYMRGRKIKVSFKSRAGDKEGTVYGQQLAELEGEDMKYDKFIVFECIPQNYEMMVDTDYYFKEFNSFTEPEKG